MFAAVDADAGEGLLDPAVSDLDDCGPGQQSQGRLRNRAEDADEVGSAGEEPPRDIRGEANGDGEEEAGQDGPQRRGPRFGVAGDLIEATTTTPPASG